MFLLLVFFLVAGTLAPPLDRDIQLIDTTALPPGTPPDAVVLHADGRISFQGVDVTSAEAFLKQARPEVVQRTRIVPDRSVPARNLIALARNLTAAGSEEIVIVTARGVEH